MVRARRRRIAALLVCGLALTAAAQVTMASAASANGGGPTPNSDTAATTTLNADGTVTATLSGTWSWWESCEIDYSTAFAVDWWGVSNSPLPANNFTLTNATETPSAGVKTTGSITAIGSQKIWLGLKYGWSYFHVAPSYSGETIHAPGTCTDSGHNYSTGSWTASATYPSASVLPPALCVNMYDPQGWEGDPSDNPQDYDPVRNWDSSVVHHEFDPRPGYHYCVTTPTPPPPPPKYGYVEICQDGANGVTGNFTFVFAGVIQTVPANACGPAVQVPAGALTVTQVPRDGFAVFAATAGPGNRLISSTPSKYQAVVAIVAGGISSQTIVRFYDTLVSGLAKVCQVAGNGVAVGTNFAYTTSTGGSFTVPAGPAPGGYCELIGTYTGQLQITQAATDTYLSHLSVAPATRFVSYNGASRTVTIQIGSGVTETTFTNVK